MCAGCFSHLLADARLKDESATCPNCRCELNKNQCSRNLAVEKAISELPAECQFCLEQLPRSGLEYHERELCQERCVPCAIPGTPFNPSHSLFLCTRIVPSMGHKLSACRHCPPLHLFINIKFFSHQAYIVNKSYMIIKSGFMCEEKGFLSMKYTLRMVDTLFKNNILSNMVCDEVLWVLLCNVCGRLSDAGLSLFMYHMLNMKIRPMHSKFVKDISNQKKRKEKKIHVNLMCPKPHARDMKMTSCLCYLGFNHDYFIRCVYPLCAT